MSADVPKNSVLQQIETLRIDHAAQAMAQSLSVQGISGPEIPMEALRAAAGAAVVAVDRFPADGWPFGIDLNQPPQNMHRAVVHAFAEIVAGVFSGDTFDRPEAHLYLAAYVQRWSKVLRLRREDDPEDPDAGPCLDDETPVSDLLCPRAQWTHRNGSGCGTAPWQPVRPSYCGMVGSLTGLRPVRNAAIPPFST